MSNVRQSGFCLAMAAILACCVMVAILPRASVGADLPPPWKVHNKLLGKPKDTAGLEQEIRRCKRHRLRDLRLSAALPDRR